MPPHRAMRGAHARCPPGPPRSRVVPRSVQTSRRTKVTRVDDRTKLARSDVSTRRRLRFAISIVRKASIHTESWSCTNSTVESTRSLQSGDGGAAPLKPSSGAHSCCRSHPRCTALHICANSPQPEAKTQRRSTDNNLATRERSTGALLSSTRSIVRSNGQLVRRVDYTPDAVIATSHGTSGDFARR